MIGTGGPAETQPTNQPTKKKQAMTKSQLETKIADAQRALFSANYAYGKAYALEVRLTDRIISGEVYGDHDAVRRGLDAALADAQRDQRDALVAAKAAFLEYSDAVIALAKLESLAS